MYFSFKWQLHYLSLLRWNFNLPSRDRFHSTITCENEKFHPGKMGQFLTLYFFRYACIFFEIFFVKPGLHCTIYSTFTPHFMWWKYFGNVSVDKHLFHKFNKLKTKLKNKQNISQISDFKNSLYKAFVLYLPFIFCTFSFYPWQLV